MQIMSDLMQESVPAAVLAALVFVFSRFVADNCVFDTAGTAVDDAGDCTASPLLFNACSLDSFHINTALHIYIT